MKQQQMQEMYHRIPDYPYNGRFTQEKLQTPAISLSAYQRGYNSVMNAGNFARLIIPFTLFIASLVLVCVAEWRGVGTSLNTLVIFCSVMALIASAIALMYGIVRLVR